MSVMDERGIKVVLPRSGQDPFWETVGEHYAGDSFLKWKRLAMVALYEMGGWPLERIAFLFGHPKGHVWRSIQKTRDDLRDRFRDGRIVEGRTLKVES